MKGIIICLLCAVLAGCQSSPNRQIAPPQALDNMAGQPATRSATQDCSNRTNQAAS